MKAKVLLVLAGLASLCALRAEEEYELLPDAAVRPFVFTSKPNEFAGTPDARAVSFPVDGAKLFAGVADFGSEAAVKVRVRALDAQTEAVEITLHQRDGKVWGVPGIPFDDQWTDVLLPFGDLQYFAHWGLPPCRKDDVFDPKRLVTLRFCFGKWLCRRTVDKPHGLEVASVKIVRVPKGAFGDGRDHCLDEFPPLPGEPDDTARFQRAIDATPAGTLTVPRGVYRISSTLRVTNRCSFDLNKNAILRAVRPMKVVMRIDSRGRGCGAHDYNVFFRGGVIDGDGMASCLQVMGFVHYTLRESTFLNGKAWGLRVDGGCEVMANNLYFKCVKSGLAGNCAVYVNGGDSHYTDCIAVDYTIGFNLASGGSNRLTRCHVWGGPVPPPRKGELPEMLKDSVNFRVGGGSAILRDCYADTGAVGYEIVGHDVRLLGCSYFNNKVFGLDGITIIRHRQGRLLVSECGFVKTTPNVKVYEGNGQVEWRNMSYSGFGEQDDCPGALTFRKKSATAQPALNLAE
ncbi:MAG: hypothetical protein ACI4Q3_07240 [Kiritimatiellia bacterium]